MPPDAAKPEKLVFNQSLLKAFVAGELTPQIEDRVVAFVQQRPKSLEQAVAHSGDGFLVKLKAVQQRTASNGALVKATAIAPGSIQPGSAAGAASGGGLGAKNESNVFKSVVPGELASYAGYRIVKELGRGGMGVVYLAKNIQMDRLEVLKVLSERLLDHEGAKERFLREIRAVSKLNHVNIVTSYSILPLNSLLVFAMEHVHGMDLHGFIHKHTPLPIGLACTFAKQLAAGLQHAHEKGLVHRDIKPSNAIVYKSDGQLQLKILDFGLAKATSEDNQSGLTQDGTMLGTPEYMSPEQTLNAAKADIRADIYSLGCTLYCMLTGQPPFRGTHGEVLMAHAQRDPRSVNLMRPEVPVELSTVVAKMMAKDVAKRFQTPAEVAAALAPFASQSHSSSRAPAGNSAASSTVHDLQASDRDTSVDAPAPSLSLDTSSQVVQPTSQLAEIAREMGEHRRAVTQVARAKYHKRRKWLAPKWMWPAVIAGVMMMFFGGLWLAGIFKLKTPDGTIVVEQLPEDADVLVDGRRLEIAWNKGRDRAEVTIEPGTHQLKVTSKGIEVFGNQVQVRSGQILAVRCEPLSQPLDSIRITSNERVNSNPAAIGQRSEFVYEDGFDPIFNGSDFTGWEGELSKWEIRENAITLRQEPLASTTYLLTERTYGDFELRLQFKMSNHGNSGVQFRTAKKVDGQVAGHQVEIGFSTLPKTFDQSIFGNIWGQGTKNDAGVVADANDRMKVDAAYRSGDWNNMTIRCSGAREQVWINNVLAVDATIKNPLPLTGKIGLQGFFSPRHPSYQPRLAFRRLRIKVEESTALSQVFSAGSTWVGINGSKVRITVLDCDGTRFRINLLQVGGNERIVRGNLSGNGISWLAKDVEAVRGGPGGDNFGVLRSDSTGSVIDFGYRDQSTGNSGTFSVRLDEPTRTNMAPADAMSFGRKRIKLFHEKLSWHEAKSRCEKMGGKLIQIESDAENHDLLAIAKQAGVDSVWLGATDESHEGTWTWTDGNAVEYAPWGPRQPNNKQNSEHYALLLVEYRPKFVGTWCDQPDNAIEQNPAFVCEWPTR